MHTQCASCGDSLNIVDVIEHDCDRILSADTLTSRERSTLLYIEARLVYHGAQLDPAQINYEDRTSLTLFSAVGIIDVQDFEVTRFTDDAWDLAAECRKHRAAQRTELVTI